MIRVKPNDADKSELESVLGKKLGETLHLIEEELTGLALDWNIYKNLFGTSQERVDILNNALGLVAVELDESMYDSILSRISRLTDGAEYRGNENVSLRRLVECSRKAYGSENQLLKDLEKHLEVIKESTDEIRKLRNKALGHNDYASARAGYEDISRPSRRAIENAIQQIEAVCNLLRTRKELPTCWYLPTGEEPKFKRLFYILQKGYEQFEKKDNWDYVRWDC